jgi:HD domain
MGLVVVLVGVVVAAASMTPALSRGAWGVTSPATMNSPASESMPLLALAALVMLFLVCDWADTPLSARQAKWSPSSAATLAAVVLLGPLAAAFVGASSVLSLRPKLQLPERMFNGAMHALSGLAAGAAYLAVGHWLARLSRLPVSTVRLVGLPEPSHFAIIIGAFAAAAAVHVLANYGLIWGIYRLNRGTGMLRRERFESSLPLLLASDYGYACLGLVIASLWHVMAWFAAALVLVTLFVARWAMGQFAGQQRAHAATMNALCQAVETKDYYTRGHGDRVSRGAVMIARKIRMSPARTEAIRFAGMLHDVGKLGVPIQVLQKTGALTEDELAAIQLHPKWGLEIVKKIGFLNEALTGITHHHEKIDGSGYPMGLAGHEIPEFARIIAVADAFDSMTTTRSYREAKSIEFALDQLRKGAGTQFDALLVAAFIAALDERKGAEADGSPSTPPA